MDYAWYDLAGNAGVALMVVGYLLLQAEKIRSSDLSYSLMNGVGALLGSDFAALPLQPVSVSGRSVLAAHQDLRPDQICPRDRARRRVADRCLVIF